MSARLHQLLRSIQGSPSFVPSLFAPMIRLLILELSYFFVRCRGSSVGSHARFSNSRYFWSIFQFDIGVWYNAPVEANLTGDGKPSCLATGKIVRCGVVRHYWRKSWLSRGNRESPDKSGNELSKPREMSARRGQEGSQRGGLGSVFSEERPHF